MPAGCVHSQTCWHCGQAALLTAWRQMRTGLRHPQILQVRVGGGKGLIMKDRKQEDIRLEPNYHNPHSGKAVPCEKWTTPHFLSEVLVRSVWGTEMQADGHLRTYTSSSPLDVVARNRAHRRCSVKELVVHASPQRDFSRCPESLGQ